MIDPTQDVAVLLPSARPIAFGRVGRVFLATFWAALLTPGPATAEILIGLATPANGREHKAGEAMRQAAERVISGLNADGGVLGEPLALQIRDDQCSAAGAVAAANAFVQKQVKLVLGHPCASAALAAAQVYGSAGVVFIAPATRHPALTDKRAGKTIFRLSGRDDRQSADAALWLIGQAGSGPIAIVHDKTAYSRGLAAGVSAALIAKAQAAPLALPITAGENVYAPVIAKLKEVKPRAVFFAGYPAEADIIVSALRGAGLAAPVLGSDSLATAEFTTQHAARDASVFVLSRFSSNTNAMAAPGIISAAPHASAIESSPALIAAQIHIVSAINSWAQAAKRAASLEPGRISSELSSPATVTAPSVAFDDKGDALVTSFFAMRWSGKDWVSQNAPPR